MLGIIFQGKEMLHTCSRKCCI